MATRPPGARHCGSERSSASSADELVVHGDAQRLERAADRHLDVGLRQVRAARRSSPVRTTRSTRVGRRERLLLQETGDELRVRLVGVLREQRGELRPRSTRASSCDAGSPRDGFIRMSSGPAPCS